MFTCDGLIDNKTISRNSASDFGGRMDGCQGTIQNKTITDSTAYNGGGGSLCSERRWSDRSQTVTWISARQTPVLWQTRSGFTRKSIEAENLQNAMSLKPSGMVRLQEGLSPMRSDAIERMFWGKSRRRIERGAQQQY